MRGYYELQRVLKTSLENNIDVNTVLTTDTNIAFDINKKNIYPIAEIDITSGTVNQSGVNLQVSIIAMDRVNQSKDTPTDKFVSNQNEIDVYNTMLYVLRRTYRDLKEGKYEYDFDILNDPTIDKVVGQENLSVGWTMSFEVEIPDGEMDICIEPELRLNVITYSTGNAPSLSAFATLIGLTLINGRKINDVIYFDNQDYVIPTAAFINNALVLSIQTAAIEAEANSFEASVNLTGGFNNLITIGNSCFKNCTGLEDFNFESCDVFGTTTGDNDVFLGITGKTITVTAKVIHQTSNAGGLEGDLQYLADNNTVTFIWV